MTQASKADTVAARELEIYIVNTESVYRQYLSAVRNLMRKRARGAYDSELAVKLFRHTVDAGAKAYCAEFCESGCKPSRIFDSPTRDAVARELRDDFEIEADLGNYKEV